MRETKVCKICGNEKPFTDYWWKHKTEKYVYLSSYCKECEKIVKRKSNLKNRDKNKEKYLLIKDEKNGRRRERYWANRDKILPIRREKDKSNPKVKEYAISYREDNKEILNKKALEWSKLPEVKIRRNIKKKERRQNDVGFRMEGILRCRIGDAIREQKCRKSYRTLELIGCSIDKLIEYLESKFLPGMSWENHGRYGWHLDHILPCSSFDLTNPWQQKLCFHYTNLQPLWAVDNLTKSDKIEVFTSEGNFWV